MKHSVAFGLIASRIGVGFDFNRTALLFHRKVFGLFPHSNAYTPALAVVLRPPRRNPIGLVDFLFCHAPVRLLYRYSVQPIWHNRLPFAGPLFNTPPCNALRT